MPGSRGAYRRGLAAVQPAQPATEIRNPPNTSQTQRK